MSFEEFTKFLSSEEIELGKQAIKAFAMPFEKREPNDIKHLEWDFFWYWQLIVIGHKIDNEHLYTYPSYEIGVDDFNIWEREENETKRALLNHHSWIKKASEEFKQRTKIFYSHLAHEEDYLKHFSNPQWSTKRILDISQERALLLPKTNMDILDKIFVELIESFHAEMYFDMSYNYIAHTQTMVGYSKRKDCYDLLYKIDANMQIYHVYPIHEGEVKLSLIEFANYPAEYLEYIENRAGEYVQLPDNRIEAKLL